MSVDVELIEVEETDTNLAECLVTTTDAAGNVREYKIGLDPTNTVDSAIVQSGSRVDEDAPDEPAGGGVSELAWNASAEHFEERGFEVAFR